MKVNRCVTRKPRIEMLPLIDIVFLLLVFFIYAMLSMAVHRGLPVMLPTSSVAEIEKESILSITVTSDGRVFVDEIPIPLDRLTPALKQQADGNDRTGVMLFADRQLSYQALFGVLDRIRKAGIHRISLEAEADDRE